MDQSKKNKEFIIGYFNAISGVIKTGDLIDRFVADEGLKSHIAFFDGAFPKYELLADEVTAENNRVVVRARMKGTHMGDLSGIPPTYKTVEFPFAIGYEIQDEKIISHWLIADQMSLMEQLGVLPAAASSH